ncbi:MAG: TonB-dependent receptor [Pyrinomonadaceae bacterium]|nr:TonB-dependent receptor [Pyrinomonadaceae bacterium]
MKKLIICLTLILFSAVGALAQSQSKIVGTVKDQNDAAVVGARVFLLDTQTRMERTTTSGADGVFKFENLAAGAYQIRIAAENFAVQKRDVSLSKVETANLDFALEIGESRLTVTAEVGQIEQTENVPQPVSIITTNEILQRTTSVIAQIGEEEVGLNVQRTSPTIGAVVVRGLTGKNVVNYVDGVRYTNGAQRGGINTFLNLNDPSNFSTVEVLRGPNAAQYGSDSLGGTVNLLTKSPVFGDTPKFGGEIIPSFNTANRSFGSSVLLSYGTNKLGGYVNIFGRRANTLRTADGIDSHSAITRFLGLPSDILYDRSPNTEFTQYGGAVRLNYAPRDDRQIAFFYQRGQQDEGKRFDQLLGGDGNLLADLRNLMLDFGYLRYVKQNFGFFDSASFTVSYNSQREERVNQGGQGNPFGDITNQYERTSATGFSFFLDKQLPFNNTFLVGGDFYHEKVNSPAFTTNPATRIVRLSRPRVPDEARFDSGGLYVQDTWQAIPDRLRITGALRYSAAVYKVRGADSPVVGGARLFNDDSLRAADFSGRVGAVVRIAGGFRAAFNYSRGFRYPNITDLGTLGLTGDGFEVDYLTSINLGGKVGTTAGASAVSTGLPVEKQRSEYSNNYDASLRWTHKRFDTELTIFRLDLEDTITKRALILPPGAVGRFLGDQPITNQLANGVVFVPLSTAPVLVRSNFTSAKLFGIEYELETRITRDFNFKGNFTYIRAEDKATGLPPNIEGGTPPPTGFLSLKYAPAGQRFWVEGYTTLADKQSRFSSLDLGDRRTGAPRSRNQIQNFFRRGACVNGLTTPGTTGICGSAGGILTATGETLAQVQNRLLPIGATVNGVTIINNDTAAPLFTSLPSYALFNLRGGLNFGEKSQIFVAFENIFDNFHRNPSWGIDGAGRSLTVQYRYKF